MDKEKNRIVVEVDLKPKIRFLKPGQIFRDKTKYYRKRKHKVKENDN